MEKITKQQLVKLLRQEITPIFWGQGTKKMRDTNAEAFNKGIRKAIEIIESNL